MAKNGGMAAAQDLHRDGAGRALELRQQGKRVIGYFYCLVPVEMLTAFGLVPYRMAGNAHELAVESGAYLETNACSFVHSCLDLALRGQYDFLDGLVVPHSCDHFVKAYPIFKHHFQLPYTHFLNVPHLADESSREFFRMELETFGRSLERFTKESLQPARLQGAIELHNHLRASVRKLYELRKTDPPLVSGSEMVRILSASSRLPVEESKDLIDSVVAEVRERTPDAGAKATRVMVYGTVVDDPLFMELIEQSRASVVMDILDSGWMNYMSDVESAADPLDALSRHYLAIPSPRTYNQPRTGSHEQDVEARFGYLYDCAREFAADAVILYALRHCEVFGFDLPDVRDYLQARGLPVLVIEDEYAITGTARLKTRIEAFLEAVREGKRE